MKNKLDELFSIERLRRNWELPEKDETAPSEETGTDDVPPEPMAVFQRLAELVDGRFPEDVREPLTLLMAELEALLRQRFVESGDAKDADAEPLNRAIETLINQIEDLIDALNLELV